MQDNYSVAGSRPTGQMFLLDNTDIRDFWEHGTGSGYSGTSLGVEAIGEFQVLTNTYTAQFAGNGAVINAASRSGTNDFHGGAYEFFRNNVLDARDIVDPLSGPPPFRRNQFGGDLGGPIKKDKLFFFRKLRGTPAKSGDDHGRSLFPSHTSVQGMLPCSAAWRARHFSRDGGNGCTPSTAANSTQPGVSIGTFQARMQRRSKSRRCTAFVKGASQLRPRYVGSATFPETALRRLRSGRVFTRLRRSRP